MTRKPWVYVISNYRNDDPAKVQDNIRVAREQAEAINATGLAWAVCPHNFGTGFESSLPDEQWLDFTMSILEVCQGTRDTYQANQDGCVNERARANELGIPTSRAAEDLLTFLLTLPPAVTR